MGVERVEMRGVHGHNREVRAEDYDLIIPCDPGGWGDGGVGTRCIGCS